MYAAARPTYYVDPDGREFTTDATKKYGPDGAPTPVLSGTVSADDLKQYLAYVEKHGSREQVLQATLGATGVYSQAYGQGVARLEAEGIAGTVASAPVALVGGGTVVASAVGGGATGFVSGLVDGVSAAELAVRTAAGAAWGASLGWAAEKLVALKDRIAAFRASSQHATIVEPRTQLPGTPDGQAGKVYQDNPTLDVPPALAVPPAMPAAPNKGPARTQLVYSIRDAEGRVIYVGRTSGVGTPQQVLNKRVSTHTHKNAGRFQIEETHQSYGANRGAEEVIFQRERLLAESEGRTLLNKDLPISPRNPRKRGYVDDYVDEWLRGEPPR